jgi:hypothetical protein
MTPFFTEQKTNAGTGDRSGETFQLIESGKWKMEY